jgi:Ca-activated chloride channel family protein
VGNFFDVKDETVLNHVMNVVVSQALNNTTAQVNLLDAYGSPTVTNIEMTFYDHFSHNEKYDFIHTLNAQGNPDTLHLDPLITYDLVVHTYPQVSKDTIKLNPGSHNVIAVDVPLGILSLQIPNNKDAFVTTQCIVRESGTSSILNVQDFNTDQNYISGNYDLEILTVPKLELYNEELTPGKPTVIKIDPAGTLNVTTPETGVASIYTNHDGKLQKVYDFGSIKATATLQIQPGDYILIWRPDKGKQSIFTEQLPITVKSSETLNEKLD